MSENVTATETFDPAEHVREMVGRHYRAADYYEVGREKVREYARAVQDFNPVHWEGDAAKALGYPNVVAPLTFMSLVGTLAQKRLLQKIAVGFDLSQMLQTDQILQYHQPIVAGDHLYCDVSLDSYKEVMGKDMMVTKNIVSNQRNELVQTTYTTLLIGREGDVDKGIVEAAENLVMQGATSLAARADAAAHEDDEQVEHPPLVVVDTSSSPTVTFDSVSVGDTLPSKTFRLTRGDLVNYAGVAGDANPIHWSEQFAKLIDLDNVLAHGMLTMGLGGGYITEWLGDPGAVKDYTVRFTAPIPVDGHRAAEIKFEGKIKSLDPESRTAVVALNATFEGKRIFGHRATATVTLA
ncbi:MAG: fused (3R)-hydroxyacyl-ACP dehydratase subunits HadA/HadB [Rhodococcus sp. (in: high G+C Gram-positive bacteria)]|jgi:acyl dehydratase|uniref:fused (3R)-hydroxyacyl-ACP dehydratase subunits HadA/HadB n=1 Tax=Rhodococcus sp. EPR-157 TaxID=1813677 RepID=UPI0007BB756C|nr:fused (3R)-hydroxyacyl-ACP dehydratase subunits HadA/HadB [Rhodococcus sp. EPR-157]KZF09496.1 (R)-hydratase [Rhodococcus sp. EPR-157]